MRLPFHFCVRLVRFSEERKKKLQFKNGKLKRNTSNSLRCIFNSSKKSNRQIFVDRLWRLVRHFGVTSFPKACTKNNNRWCFLEWHIFKQLEMSHVSNFPREMAKKKRGSSQYINENSVSLYLFPPDESLSCWWKKMVNKIPRAKMPQSSSCKCNWSFGSNVSFHD